jgi:hypothetical protein
VTALAPPPEQGTAPQGGGAPVPRDGDLATVGRDADAVNGSDDVSVEDDGPIVEHAGSVDIRLAPLRPEPFTPAALASWVFGVALAMLGEGTAEAAVIGEVMAEAAGRSSVIEGAYGRAVALLSEFPGDPLVRRTIDLLAKTLLRSRRPARAAEEA